MVNVFKERHNREFQLNNLCDKKTDRYHSQHLKMHLTCSLAVFFSARRLIAEWTRIEAGMDEMGTGHLMWKDVWRLLFFFTFNISIYTQTLNMLAFVASTRDWKYASNTCTRAVSMIVWWNWSIFSFSSHRHQCNVLFSKYYCFGDNRANIRFFLTYIVYCELMRWQRNTASHTNHSEMLLFVFNERKRWTYFLGLWWNMIN